MAELPERRPDKRDHDSRPAVSSQGLTAKGLDGFLTVIMTLPAVAKTLILVVVVIVAGALLYLKFIPGGSPSNLVPSASSKVSSSPVPGAPPSIQTVPATQPYTGGKQIDHPGAENNNPQNVEANHDSSEAEAAELWHRQHDRKTPNELPLVPDTDADNFVHFRYYANTDKCVWIHREIAGVPSYQWAEDSVYCQHSVHLKARETAASTPLTGVLPQTRVANTSALLDLFTRPVFASVSLGIRARGERVQAGYCQNPHPGQFNYWWGAPIDQCNSPMFRQFGDGCTHYQVYNRCANAWDGRIFWTICKALSQHY